MERRNARGTQRISSRPEGVFVALWALVFAAYVVVMVQLEPDPWTSGLGLWIVSGFATLAIVFGIGATRVRTVRPRYFRMIEGLAALWAAIGCSIAVQNLAGEQGPNGFAVVVVAIAVAAPLLMCAAWLWTRGR